MGLTATCDEGEITVRYNDKVLQRHFLENWFEIKEAELLSDGVDYVESYTYREMPFGDVNSQIAKCPPNLIVSSTALSRQLARSKSLESRKDSWPDCKEFNVEVQVDARFIHHVVFGWKGYVNTSFAQLHTDLTAAQEFLKHQQGYKLLETRCKDLSRANFPITNIIVLGSGTLHMPYAHHAAKYTQRAYDGLCNGPLAQLAAITEIRTLIGGERKPLPCIFQDPMTSKLEQQFLQSLGHKVVDDPDAFSLINSNSLVIFLHNPGMEEWIVRGAPPWPAAMVFSALAGPEGYLYPGREEIKRQIQEFKEAYKILPFMEKRLILPEGSKSGSTRSFLTKYNFHLKKDLDGAAGFSFTV